MLRGLTNFYAEFINNKNNINRWIYIIRFSCLKTLAQKDHTSIRKLFRRFRIKDAVYQRKYGDTVEVGVNMKIGDETWEKKWHLYTYLELLEFSLALKRKQELEAKFKSLENPDTPFALASNHSARKVSGRTSKVTDDNYLDTIKWVSWRTQAALSMPCCLCRTFKNVEMHHLHHVRKNKYSSIPAEKTWEQVMHLRNRKQIPVCTACHRSVIHKGTYDGPRLINMVPKTLVDNRVVHIESFVKRGKYYGAKNFQEKGWKIII